MRKWQECLDCIPEHTSRKGNVAVTLTDLVETVLAEVQRPINHALHLKQAFKQTVLL